MTSAYRVKAGHDQPDEELVTVSPQPRSEGVQVTRRTYAADGTVVDEGRYIELVWSVVNSVAEYQSILNQFGVGGATKTADVTVHVPDQDYAYDYMNGVAYKPDIGRDVQRRNYMIRNLVILVRIEGFSSPP